MQLMRTFGVLLISCTISSPYTASDADEIVNLCARIPHQRHSQRAPGDGGFKITVDDDQRLLHYAPERLYRISISGSSARHTFSGAYLVAVPFNSSYENVTIGKFHLVDGGRLAFHIACSHAVTTVDRLPKGEVFLMWTSPALGSGCVEFRATVIKDKIWYKDKGALTKVLCAEQTNSGNIPTAETSACCACSTAKYQLTFHSLLSQTVHPHDTADTSLFHWSPVVGSSHSKHYIMWQFNTLASHGVSDICQFGDTRALEDEIRQQSSNIRTVIKTPGIQWTKEHGLQQQRWAHFSVDSRHHLLSLLSRLSPSPDWCVGISALDLCLDNCTWLSDTTVRLFAWDAGVHSSTAENWQSDPAQPIHHLPDHADSNPFRGIGPSEPVALLQLHRFDPMTDALECSPTGAKDQSMNKHQATDMHKPQPQDLCVMGAWSQWSECSASCGRGTRTRTRTAVVMTDSCPDLLEMRSEPCRTAPCVKRCELYDWSEWSTCTDGFVICSPNDMHVVSCSRRRSRFFRHRGADAFCNDTVQEKEPCRSSETGILTAFNTNAMSKCFSLADIGPCELNLQRWYYDAVLNKCRTFLYGGCRGNANRYRTEEQCMRACRQYARHNMVPRNGAESESDTPSGISRPTELPESGYITLTSDHNGTSALDCVVSTWSSWSSCSATCGRNGVRTRARRIMQSPSGRGKKCPRRKLRRRRCPLPACVECQYTEWSSWSACARSCGTDVVQERIQRVQGSLSLRSLCPVKLQRRLCALPLCTAN